MAVQSRVKEMCKEAGAVGDTMTVCGVKMTRRREPQKWRLLPLEIEGAVRAPAVEFVACPLIALSAEMPGTQKHE